MSSNPPGFGQRILYLDFDGVLHPADVYAEPGSPPVLSAAASAAGHALFEHAETLAAILEPFPAVQIVLATSWARGFGHTFASSKLPEAVRARVCGAVFDAERHGRGFASMPRGYQVLDDVKHRRPSDWVALDDEAKDWPEEHIHRLINTDPVMGLGHLDVQRNLQRWLRTR